MSDVSQEIMNQSIKKLFEINNLTGFDVARNSQIATIVKSDSTDFANAVIHHQRGRQIICELIDATLRPQTLINYLADQNNQKPQYKNQTANLQTQNTVFSNEMTAIVYNAFQILTNQYEEFVQYVFEQQKNSSNVQSDNIENQKNIENSAEVKQPGEQNKTNKKQSETEEDWDDCVIMDANFPELTKNQEDSVLKKIADLSKLNQSQFLKCTILDRMILLFNQPAPIQETPVSYFNKIILQFVYQRPEQIMRFFYCDQNGKDKSNLSGCNKIQKISKHLYNNSVVELLVHIMELQNEGNFFVQQKIQIFKTIVEEVFFYQESQKENTQSDHADTFSELSTVSDLMGQKVKNYVLLLKSLYEKLEDKYQQEKFIPILKYHLNDQKLMQKIINYFFFHFNYFDMSGLLALLIQVLKMDQINFKIHKAATQNGSLFGNNNNLSFNNKNQESSTASYDLKLTKNILDQFEKVIVKITSKFDQWQVSTMRMVEYYELVHNWLNVTLKDKNFKNNLLTPNFINECLYKMQSHERSTILHNAVKNILVDFLPKINESIKMILSPQCQLIPFVQNCFQNSSAKGKKKVKKCYENQLYHIGKTILSVWQQQKMLNVMTKTKQDEKQQMKRRHSQQPKSPTSDGENIIRFQSLRNTLAKKQQFYEHLICGDPRKMGEQQQEESSQIIMASSFKNFFKPAFLNNTVAQSDSEPVKNLGNNRYGQEADFESNFGQQSRRQSQDSKKQNTTKNTKIRNLRIGDEQLNAFFQSAISPMNANRSHTFNFDFDALPLDSDNSDQVQSEQQDLPQRGKNKSGTNEDEMKLMQENLQNFEIVRGNILGVQTHKLELNNSFNNEKDLNMLSCDNYRKQSLSKSVDMPDDELNNIQKVDSYLAMESPRKQSEQDMVSLGLDSKESESKLSDQNRGSKLQNFETVIRWEGYKIDEGEQQQIETVDSNFVKLYSSYLRFDLDKLCSEVEQM